MSVRVNSLITIMNRIFPVKSMPLSSLDLSQRRGFNMKNTIIRISTRSYLHELSVYSYKRFLYSLFSTKTNDTTLLSSTKDPIIDHYLSVLDETSENLHLKKPKTLYHVLSLINAKILPLLDTIDKSKVPNINIVYSTVFGHKLYSQLKLKQYVETIKTLEDLERNRINIDENMLYVIISRISKLPNSSESVRVILEWIASQNALERNSNNQIIPTNRLIVAIMSCLKRINDLYMLLPMYELFKTLPNHTAESMTCLMWVAIRSRNYPLLRIYLSDLPKILDNSLLMDIPPAVYCQIIESLEPESRHVDTAMMAFELYCNHPLSKLNVRILKASIILAEKNLSINLAKMVLSKATGHELVRDIYCSCLSISIAHLNEDPTVMNWIVSLLREMEPICAYSVNQLCSIVNIIVTSDHRQSMIDVLQKHSGSNVIFHVLWMIQRIANPIDLSNHPDDILSRNNLPLYKDNILHFQLQLSLAIILKSSEVARRVLIQQLNHPMNTSPQLSLDTIPILVKALFQHHDQNIDQLNQSKRVLLLWISRNGSNTVLLTRMMAEIRVHAHRIGSLDHNITFLYESLVSDLNRHLVHTQS